MLKQLMISAFAVTAVSAFAQDMDNFDYKTANTYELNKYVVKSAYKVLPAGDAYTIAKFVGGLPGNRKTAILRGLAQNAAQAKMVADEKMMAANMMAPMGDKMWMKEDMKPMDSYPSDSSRPFRMLADAPNGDLNYEASLKILTSGLDVFDQGLIYDLFTMKPFTVSMIPTVWNEKELDAITHYIQANAKMTEPARLKYTSMAPRRM